MRSIPNFLLLTLLFSIKIVFAQPGSLDPTFGIDGKLNLHPVFTADETKDIALTNDGKVLLLSSNYQIGNYLIRLMPDGQPDLTFGVNGKKYLAIASSIATAIEVDQQNRILVYSLYDNFYTTSMYVTRLEQNGTKDLTFGNAGKKETLVSRGNRALTIQSDNKIVAAGRSSNDFPNINRLNEDGSYDSTFNSNSGNALSALSEGYIFSVKQQPDGKLLATGTSKSRMFAARFNSNGQLDNSFEGDGIAIFSSTDTLAGQDIAVTSDGKILIVGHGETSSDSRLLCWQLLPDGTLDTSFGTNGIDVLYDGEENNFGWFVFSQVDTTAIVGASLFDRIKYQPILFRLLKDGSLDSTFGTKGIAGKTFDCGRSIQLNGRIDPDGNIVYSGTGFDNGNDLVSVSRLHNNGKVDSSFAINGTASVFTFDSVYTYCDFQDLFGLNDGKILCTGNVLEEMVIFRLNNNGTLDSSYGGNGFYVPNQRILTQAIYYDEPSTFMAANDSSIYMTQQVYRFSLGDEDLCTSSPKSATLLHKLDGEGNVDTTFGAGGIKQLIFHASDTTIIGCTDLKLLVDGKLLFAGGQTNGFKDEVFLARLNPDGSLDSTFAINGEQHFNLPYETYQLSVAIRDDGKINCVFIYYGAPYEYHMSISRLLPDGSFDASFGVNGIETIEIDFHDISELFMQGDNKMSVLLTKGDNPYTAIIRMNEDGSIDSTFADYGFLYSEELIYGRAGAEVQPDGKILYCNGSFDLSVGLGTSRYLVDGSTDLAFGVNGTASITGTSQAGSSLHRVRLQSDGKILIASEDYLDFFIARLLNDVGVSVNDQKVNSSWEIYPNPVSDYLIITNPFLQTSSATISITDLSGKVLLEKQMELADDKIICSVSDLPSGIYILRGFCGKDTVVSKLVKP